MKSFKELHKKYSMAKLIKKCDDRYGFQALVRILTGHWFNPFSTLYVNMFSFPFKQAIKMPIFVYGNPGIYYVVGNMKIEGDVKTGMISINKTMRLNPPNQLVNSELCNLGTIVFHGKARIGCGSKLLVQKGALLELGEDVLIGDNVNFGCHQHIFIGNKVRISHRCQIQESNHHFLADMGNRIIRPCTRPISIGNNCWICNSSTLTAGSVIPDFCIVASNSLISGNKKEITNAPSGSIIGGIPAKVISSKNIYRIYNLEWEGKLFLWFENHKNEMFELPEDLVIDEMIM